MKGFILAAGMGTRLKPWTDHHPKALVPVGGIPMLRRVIEKMLDSGITDITVNAFHFADQIAEFLKDYPAKINISDERPLLLETGGGLVFASEFLKGDQPILVHNADILSNADFRALEQSHLKNGADATLLVSRRESSRKLIFDENFSLVGWHSVKDDVYRPFGFSPKDSDVELAFSGIYIISPPLIEKMKGFAGMPRFPIMDYLLTTLDSNRYKGHLQEDLNLVDIGKPDSLSRANSFFKA